jgi:hypothetical protein
MRRNTGINPQRYLPDACVSFAHFAGEEIAEELIDKQVIDGTLDCQVEGALAVIRSDLGAAFRVALRSMQAGPGVAPGEPPGCGRTVAGPDHQPCPGGLATALRRGSQRLQRAAGGGALAPAACGVPSAAATVRSPWAPGVVGTAQSSPPSMTPVMRADTSIGLNWIFRGLASGATVGPFGRRG